MIVRVVPAANRVPGAVVPTDDCLDVRDVGTGGGPIDVRFPATLGRGFVVDIDGTRPLDGVPVLGVDAAEVPADASCFVGDLVGDLGVY